MALRGVLYGGREAFTKRLDNAILICLPAIGTLAFPIWLTQGAFGWIEISAFMIGYAVIGLGITVGLHRHFTHRSFEANRILRFCLAAAAAMACQGSLPRWIADHRRHHALSDVTGDPHSPWVDGRGRSLSGLGGFFHAHFGWMFDDATTDMSVFGADLKDDRLVMFFGSTHWLWFGLNFAVPWLYGFLLGGASHAMGCLLFAGCFRTFLFHHATWSVNSVCHLTGKVRFRQKNRSRNNYLVAILTFGEGCHNNHHRFPRSAFHGLGPGEPDMSGALVRLLERLGLVSEVIRPSTHGVR